MAITPIELNFSLTVDVKPIVDELEPEIDKYLKQKATQGERNEILYSITGRPQAVVDEILKRYRKAGWLVQTDSDRDGRFIRFKFPVYRAGEPRPKC